MNSEYVLGIINSAVGCLEEQEDAENFISLKDFTSLRDTLIAMFMVSSLRRILEFRLSEYAEKEPQYKDGEISCFVVRIHRHKTAASGPSLVFISPREEKALVAYVRYYRPIAASCSNPKCYVFPNNNNLTACCTQMFISGMAKGLNRVVNRAGIDRKITSRILRWSQITALWEEEDGGEVWRTKVADQCAHSLSTASRYYQYAAKVKTEVVIERLKGLRQKTM